MEIKTKFNLGDKVYPITYRMEVVKQTCNLCEGKGFVYVKTKKILCPEEGCYGKGKIEKYIGNKWQLSKIGGIPYPITINRIGIEVYNRKYKKLSEYEDRIYYMEDSSRSMYFEHNCFASIEEAEKECKKRNKSEE